MSLKPKQKRKTWDSKSMLAAVTAVKNKEMGYLLASRTFKVPKSTLEDYVKNKIKSPEELIQTNLGRPPVLPKEIKADLVDYCLEMDKRFYGLRASDIRRLAFQLAIRNNLKHRFSKNQERAGYKWLRSFLKRHPELTLRRPQSLSTAPIKEFTEEYVNFIFIILEPAMEKVKFNPCRIYNIDETGITSVQSKHTRIITLKGKKQVGVITSAERGSLVTVVTCMNAAGGYVPPMVIFPRKNMKAELLNGAPPGTIAACHVSGWNQSHIFNNWLQHFISHAKPSEADPVLLILDGHYSHTRNLDTINLA